MAAAPDYSAIATSIYAPQETAQEAQLGTQLSTGMAQLEASKAPINQQYDLSGQNLQKAEDLTLNKIGSTGMARLGGNYSGLIANEQALSGQDYASKVQALELARTSKLANITGQENALQENYQAGLTSAKATENADIAKYIADQQAADRATQAQMDIAKMYTGNSGSGSSSNTNANTPSWASELPTNSSGNVDMNTATIGPWVQFIRNNFNGQNWGQIAGQLESVIGKKIQGGSAPDRALHYIFSGGRSGG